MVNVYEGKIVKCALSFAISYLKVQITKPKKNIIKNKFFQHR